MEDLTKGEHDVRRRLLNLLLRLGGGRSLLCGTCLRRVCQGLGYHTQGVGSGEGTELGGEIGRRVRGEDGGPKGGNSYRGADYSGRGGGGGEG